MFTDKDKHWMQQAIYLSEYARSIGEVPVGAILVHQDEVIGQGYNCPINNKDPSAHAEVMALCASANKLNNYRLVDTTLYVTLEPCIMCVGAIVHARVKRLVFGAFDLKAGAVVSQMEGLKLPFLNHQVEYRGGLLGDICGQILSSFFQERRKG
jgi:tRNA(adenine34) deaminase